MASRPAPGPPRGAARQVSDHPLPAKGTSIVSSGIQTSPVDRATGGAAKATSSIGPPADGRGPAAASRQGTDARLPGSAAGQSRDEFRTETSPFIGRGPAVASPCPRGPVSLLHPLQSTCVGGILPADRPEGVGGIPPADRPGAHPVQRSCRLAGVSATATSRTEAPTHGRAPPP